MPAERRRHIIEMLREHGTITVEEVQERLAVSSMTARRDLATLGESGHLLRTRGGAVVTGLSAGDPFRAELVASIPTTSITNSLAII